MTEKQVRLCERLKRMGFTRNKQVRLYGEQFELLSDPLIVGDHVVFVDAIEKTSGQFRRVRIPLTIVNIAIAERAAA